MSEWQPFLNTRASEFTHLEDGTGYGGFSNYVPSPFLKGEPEVVSKAVGLVPSIRQIPNEFRTLVPRAMFIQDGHIHILEFGHLRTRLGEDFAYALNGTRSIPYTYGLSAPLGTPLPSMKELSARDDEIKTEIARLVEGINERRDVAKEARSFSFKGGEYGEGLWDSTAREIGEGKRPLKVIFTEIDRLKPGIDEMIPEGIFSKKNFTSHPNLMGATSPKFSSATLTKLCVASVVILGGTWATYELLRRRKDDDRHLPNADGSWRQSLDNQQDGRARVRGQGSAL
jgi:hypothetical protein